MNYLCECDIEDCRRTLSISDDDWKRAFDKGFDVISKECESAKDAEVVESGTDYLIIKG